MDKKKKVIQEYDENLTFKPLINKRSEKLDQNYQAKEFNGDQLHRWDQLYLMVNSINFLLKFNSYSIINIKSRSK